MVEGDRAAGQGPPSSLDCQGFIGALRLTCSGPSPLGVLKGQETPLHSLLTGILLWSSVSLDVTHSLMLLTKMSVLGE